MFGEYGVYVDGKMIDRSATISSSLSQRYRAALMPNRCRTRRPIQVLNRTFSSQPIDGTMPNGLASCCALQQPSSRHPSRGSRSEARKLPRRLRPSCGHSGAVSTYPTPAIPSCW